VARSKIKSVFDFILGRPTDRKRTAVQFSSAVVLGTVLGWLVSLFSPLLGRPEKLLQSYLKSHLPPQSIAEGLVALVSFLLLGFILALPSKWWRSLRLGLFTFPFWYWALSVAIFWILLDAHHTRAAAVALTSAGILIVIINSIGRYSSKSERSVSRLLEPDSPVPENGEDLLGRQGAIEDLVFKILFERPMVIAVTGSYGEGG
jgi:hypothetical protein